MANTVIISEESCKGCKLCIIACPKKILQLSQSRINGKGYLVAEMLDIEQCTACGICAVICPDSVIKVEKE